MINEEEFTRQVRPFLEALVTTLRTRFPKVSDERGKAILGDVLRKGLIAAQGDKPMPTQELFKELVTRFAAESA